VTAPTSGTPPSQTSQTVASNVTAIYEGGKYLGITVSELLNNEVAIRQLINSHNGANRANESLMEELTEAREARPRTSTAITLAVMNVSGAILIGLATNYFASTSPPRAAAIILGVAVALTLFGSIAPVVLSYTARVKKKVGG